MFNLQDSLDAHKKALKEICSEARKSGPKNNTIVRATKDSIKKSLVESGIITDKGEFTNLNIS
ncbi:hypothetical protein PN36_20100 [Candidatus Thiomargarita nelsonii]|uniref:Uncharacterized protein n=1 Tax=Candidatus Thiomargarita nelsonii TaxID=1003181 RepID=A0A0A6P9Y0_9GAMM|nr:hypothetical protein PN36_20100 [Candidatus Thiomargarita nelsonii]